MVDERGASRFDDASTLLRAEGDEKQPAATFVVDVVEGPHRPPPLVVEPTIPSPALIGKGEACHLRLDDSQVSRRHISLDPTGRRLRIVDLGSKNGTFVDGLAVESAYLIGGELVRIGQTALRIEARESPSLPLPFATAFGGVVGASREMRRLYPLCKRLAASNIPVIIEGETGTGKEVLAASIHAESARVNGPYVIFDCTSVPANLFESELFGHERGAFTGAVNTRKGAFEQANGGTLFIDELGDLELSLQAKLLRVVESGEVRRVGSTKPISVDVRIVCATRRDLDREVQEGRFRDDLFHRLAVGRIELPSLRRRRGDIALLVEFFWKHLDGPSPGPTSAQVRKWEAHSWPGNVRELRNAVARFIALGELANANDDDGEVEGHGAAPVPLTGSPTNDFIERAIALGNTFGEARDRLMREFERAFVARLVEKNGGDLDRAARAAGIGRRYFNMLRSRSR